MDILERITSFAEERSDVRAAILNGSRANKNAPMDDFQDYDVALYVENPKTYLDDQTWIQTFGEILMMQQNPSKGEKFFYDATYSGYIFLMLFKEGHRIDLSFYPLLELDKGLEDTLSQVLVDKDHLIDPLPVPSDIGYWIKKPTQAEYDFIVNEYWWCMTNIAKGLWREELPYVKGMYETVVKKAYMQMIKWYIGMNHDWKVNVGAFNKWIKHYLSDEIYELIEQSYSGYDYNDIWNSVFASIKLFQRVGQMVGLQLGFDYPLKDDENVSCYLKEVRVKHTKKM